MSFPSLFYHIIVGCSPKNKRRFLFIVFFANDYCHRRHTDAHPSALPKGLFNMKISCAVVDELKLWILFVCLAVLVGFTYLCFTPPGLSRFNLKKTINSSSKNVRSVFSLMNLTITQTVRPYFPPQELYEIFKNNLLNHNL